MSLLLWIWAFALVALIGVGVRASYMAGRGVRPAYVPHDLSDLVRAEIVRMRADGREIVEAIKPHGKSVAKESLRVLRRGHDLIIERVYGRIRVEKGRASSFFLKQIAEHQGKGDARGRSM